MISYCESLRGEMRPFGVRVVTLSPGYIDTPLTRSNRYSMPFLMQPEDFAERALPGDCRWCQLPRHPLANGSRRQIAARAAQCPLRQTAGRQARKRRQTEAGQ